MSYAKNDISDAAVPQPVRRNRSPVSRQEREAKKEADRQAAARVGAAKLVRRRFKADPEVRDELLATLGVEAEPDTLRPPATTVELKGWSQS